MSAATVILVCPCCASPLDAAGDPDTEQHFTCLGCGQTWRMVVDPRRFAQHSLT